MPKILVMFYSRLADTAALAEAVADGAESVRFTEVQLRSVVDRDGVGNAELARTGAEVRPGRRRAPTLHSADELLEYDGIVVGAEMADGTVPAEIEALLSDAARISGGAFENKVGAAFASAPGSERDTGWPIVRALAGLRMIIVPATGGAATSIESARELGRRAARVTGWVHHALGHEQGHGHGHGHAHPHAQVEGGSHGHVHGHES